MINKLKNKYDSKSHAVTHKSQFHPTWIVVKFIFEHFLRHSFNGLIHSLLAQKKLKICHLSFRIVFIMVRIRVLNLSRQPEISTAVKRSVAGCKIQFRIEFYSRRPTSSHLFFSLYPLTNCYYWSIRSPAVMSRSLAVLFEIENPV